jgi:signal transduction histidine kinase
VTGQRSTLFANRRARLIVAAAAAIAGTAVFVALRTGFDRETVLSAVAEVATGWSFIAAGLIAGSRRPDSRAAALMAAVGFAWFARNLTSVETSATWTVGELFAGFEWLLLGHLLVTFPTGRVQTPFERRLVVAIYLFAVPNALGTLPFDRAHPLGCGHCPANLLSFGADPSTADAVRSALVAGGIVLAVLVLAAFALRWRRAQASGRRAFTPVLVGTTIVFATVVVGSAQLGPLERTLPGWAESLAFLSLAVGLLIGLLRSWFDRSAVGRLVVELGRAISPERLQDALARALHDPTLEVLYWDGVREIYVDSEGRQRDLPDKRIPRAATRLGRLGKPVAALIHDPVLLDDPELIQAAGEAARLALENAQLQAEVRAQLAEVRASRARIVQAADAERRRVERDLHDGAQQRLVTLALAIGLVRERAALAGDPELVQLLAEAAGETRSALGELRELGRGLHPSILTEAGLGPALESLAERSNVPVKIAAVPAERLSSAVEATAYFVTSEALANAAKYSHASSATVAANRANGLLVLEISDDGVGGADAAAGSGLRGLEDRVEALGGRLSVESLAGHGTRVVAHIPCD